mgnify:CR=1 FL=1
MCKKKYVKTVKKKNEIGIKIVYFFLILFNSTNIQWEVLRGNIILVDVVKNISKLVINFTNIKKQNHKFFHNFVISF